MERDYSRDEELWVFRGRSRRDKNEEDEEHVYGGALPLKPLSPPLQFPLSPFYSFDAIPVLPFFSPFPPPPFLALPSLDESVVMADVNDDPFASLSSFPPSPRNTLSYSQQLLDPAPSPPSAAAKRNQVHNHSLDDNQFLLHQDLHLQSRSSQPHPAIAYRDNSFVDDDDDDGCDDGFRLRSEVSAATPAAPHPSSSDPHPLPEFVAAGANTGIFKLPVRSSVHSSRPVCVELRPHPLKETQVGKFLRNMAYADGQLWAGQECGVRYWNVERAYEPGEGLGGRIRRGDEDAAPFHESVMTPPTMCLVVDCASRLVWSGHKDGKIRSWRMDQGSDVTPFKEGLSWQAHRGAILSMVMTSYGDIWTGFEGGVIKVWPWEAIEKSLSLSTEEKHMAALLVERSFMDLKSQVTVNGSCSISSSDVKCLLLDNVRAKVWAATPLSFSLWNTRTKELLKVFNIEGQMENRVDMPGNSEQVVEDETKAKLVSTSKKEKSQGSNFLQRSRNAIMGAADAVRRAATRGAGGFSEETKKTEALLLSADGRIWSGCSNGLLVQWDENGNRLRDFNHHPCAVLCFCTFGTRIYVGYISGLIQVLDLEGNVIAGWIAHTGPVINMAVGDGQIYSLATHGGIRGWNITSPGPVDNIMRTELAKREMTFTRQSHVKILVGTWNVGQGKTSQEALSSWLGSVASDVGIIVVGCQEVEMGAGFLAMSAAKESVGLEGSAIGNWWLDTIGKSLDEGNAFERMGSRQLAGLLIGLWVRKELRTHVGDVDIAAVACGFGRAIGNKGGVGLRIRVYDRIMCFVNCHLAAHLEAVNRRNADFDHIYRTMAFSKSYNVLNAAAAGVSSSAQMPRSSSNSSNSTEEGRPDLAEADMVVFLGDFNYRLFGISYDEARDFVSQRSFDWLREKDQLRAEMDEGRVFQGMREAVIKFPPTYKFERHLPGLGGYDSGEKKRIPAWCDRVIYRDNRPGTSTECVLDCPVVSSVLMYEACMDVTDSDHKPVRCKFGVQIAHTDRSVRREELGKIVRSNETINSSMADLRRVPNTVISIDDIILINQETCILKITNKCADDLAVFKFICQSQAAAKFNGQSLGHRPRGYFGFPRWLEVIPAAGVIKPEQSIEVSIRHEEHRTLEELVEGATQYLGNEDTRDKEAILGLIVQGSYSTETRTHQICVRERSPPKTIKMDSKPKNPQVSMVPRSEPPQRFGDASNENGHVEDKHHP